MDNKNQMDKALYLPETQVRNLLSQVETLTNKLNMAEAREKVLLEGLKWIAHRSGVMQKPPMDVAKETLAKSVALESEGG